MIMISLKKTALIGFALAALSCSNPAFKEAGTNILSSTGLVSASQATTFFDVGAHASKAVESLSEEQEYYLGRGVSAMILSRYQPSRSLKLQQYLNKVGKSVAVYSDRSETFGGYHFLVLDTPEINAVSAPGGFVFITTGFLKLIPNEDALAGVLAHEVAHIVKGHGLKAISRSNLNSALLLIGKEAASGSADATIQLLTATFERSISDVFETLMNNGYSRSQEYEADEYAADLLSKAGYSPASMLQTLDILDKNTQDNSQGWYKTHPDPAKRISELKDQSTIKSDKAINLGQAKREKRFSAFRQLIG